VVRCTEVYLILGNFVTVYMFMCMCVVFGGLLVG